ncbi:hypothetical protein BH23GEM9_BH23GEM9_17600 [soil metagenome]
MNHKRRRPKDRRAGCLLCKPHKSNGQKGREEAQTRQERRARAAARWEAAQLNVRTAPA